MQTVKMHSPLRSMVVYRAGDLPTLNALLNLQRKQLTDDDDASELERQRVSQLLTNVQQAILDLQQSVNDTVAFVKKTTVELAVSIAQRLLQAHVQANTDYFDTILKQALAALQPHGEVTLALHVDDVKRFNEYRESTQAFAHVNFTLNVVADQSLAMGDFRLKSGEIEVVRNLQSLLGEVKETMLHSI